MLPKINRITKKKDFETIFKLGKTAKSGFLLCRFKHNDILQNRFGFIVSKKISPKATVRNKVRRQLRNAVNSLFLEKKDHTDFLIIALSGIEKLEFSTIKEMVAILFNKIK